MLRAGGALLLLFAALAAGQNRPVPPIPSYDAPFAAAPPRIDGNLNDAIWQTAKPVEFVFPWDIQTGAKQKTRARLAWDETFLYAAYECDDADIAAKHTQRDDPTYEDDAVELYVNPRPKQKTIYFGFEMNARNVMYDYFLSFPSFHLLKSWNLPGYEMQTRLKGTLNNDTDKDEGWSLELAIPWAAFSDFAARPAPGEEWLIQLVRWDGRAPARRLSMWSDSGLKDTFPHNPERFGRVRFLK